METDVQRPSRPTALAGIALTGILAGAFIGGTTNAVNGFVSPTYFINILRWHDVENVWRGRENRQESGRFVLSAKFGAPGSMLRSLPALRRCPRCDRVALRS